ncbi:hypothetical protein [Wolbachia endosymbiont of Folsomia candida]|uniref:hypothetical protein n=1 Tax=Wolbachia endosymbiont of Folsomia candida TaxID=169402 RepID=UPI000AEADBEB|nr:hypothetical protein [Wolbachia endosymbiont of Folsomia candida]
MKVIYHINGHPRSRKNTKHVVEFFGILGCIKVNVPGKATPLKVGKLNVVEYYFDYPYFSEIINPEHFQEELSNREKRFTRAAISLWLCAAILSAASYVLLYLSYSNQKPKEVIASVATASVMLSIIACVLFTVCLIWISFNFIKEKFAANVIESHLKDLDHELVKKYKKLLVGEKQATNEGTIDQESQKNKDIEEILQFFLDRKKIPALFKFLTNGEKLVQAGMAMVNQRLLDGVSPNNIVLDTNSMGGGVATEVLKRFEAQGIYLTLIHSNSYSSLNDVANTFEKWLAVKSLHILRKFFGLELNSEETIKNIKSPVLIVGREGDPVITEPAQLTGKLNDQIIFDKTYRLNVKLQHNPNIKNCRNEKNIHIDDEEHLGCEWDNNGTTEYINYREMKSQFINAAHDYLISNKLNGKFDLKKYRESDFSKNLAKIKLVPLSPASDKINGKFDQEKYRESGFSKSLTGTKLVQLSPGRNLARCA